MLRLYAFGHINLIFIVCCMLNECYLGFIRKKMIPNAHNLPRILSAPLVTVFMPFLIIFVLNMYLFVKNTLLSEV